MVGLRCLVALTAIAGGLGLPQGSPEPDPLQLGGLFDNDSSLAAMTDLQQRQCLPPRFDPSRELLVVAQCSQRPHCPGVPIDAAIYECLAKTTGLITSDKVNKAAYAAFIKSHSTDDRWTAEKQPLADMCLAAVNTSLTGGQQAVYLFSCWQWSLVLDCDLHEPAGRRSAEARCRRAAFLAGDCPLSPPAVLDQLPGVAAERSWSQCAAARPDGPAGAADRCRRLDEAAARLLACRLGQYTGSGGRLELGRLRADVSASPGAAELKQAALQLVDECGRRAGSHVDKFVDCWAKRGIMTCAVAEAAQRAGEYQPC
ncbi:uncharacterized protein LOC122381217 isoform X2 [Amphibalanus amphitrite]|uniref:uncharacterized protein LOC122381217 isoform X2 n=1 Tax=Amphibalanus amphitrite TaxID=1232801 RepID=UPI001C91B573|nr:uncharacterized protein LOC122381217 isoform X2 [Amphibalanus amphitrite]